MPFVQYPKIKRLGEEENDGILLGTVYVQEKIDGANTSIWLEDGVIHCGSRTQDVSEKGFNGFVEYARSNPGFEHLFTDHPTWRLYGEWLVRHTIAYNETVYRHFYLFDIVGDGDRMLSTEAVNKVADFYGLRRPELFATLEYPTPEAIQEFVGKTTLGDKGEGVVLKNPTYVNKFGDPSYAKIVTQEFKEDNALVFGGNNKFSETYVEQYCVNEYMTMARVQKIMNKIQPLVEKRLGREDTARVINTAYHDMFTEEIWGIAKKFESINFKQLSRLSTRKAAKIYHDILDGIPASQAWVDGQANSQNL